MRTVYKSYDNKIFDTTQECEKYEQAQKLTLYKDLLEAPIYLFNDDFERIEIKELIEKPNLFGQIYTIYIKENPKENMILLINLLSGHPYNMNTEAFWYAASYASLEKNQEILLTYDWENERFTDIIKRIQACQGILQSVRDIAK